MSVSSWFSSIISLDISRPSLSLYARRSDAFKYAPGTFLECLMHVLEITYSSSATQHHRKNRVGCGGIFH